MSIYFAMRDAVNCALTSGGEAIIASRAWTSGFSDDITSLTDQWLNGESKDPAKKQRIDDFITDLTGKFADDPGGAAAAMQDRMDDLNSASQNTIVKIMSAIGTNQAADKDKASQWASSLAIMGQVSSKISAQKDNQINPVSAGQKEWQNLASTALSDGQSASEISSGLVSGLNSFASGAMSG